MVNTGLINSPQIESSTQTFTPYNDVDTNMPEIVQQIDAVEGENLRAMTNIFEKIRSPDNEASATRSNTGFFRL